MGAQKGKDLLLKMYDGTGFVTVAGLRSRKLSFNAETVDITHAESADRWRELLAGAGVKRASISGRGLFKDASSDALVRQTFFDGSIPSCQVVIPAFGTIEGAFQISIALNTDLTVEVTCNGGTNWTAAALSAVSANSQSGRRVVETADQPCTSGTSFAARIKTFNSKSVPIRGISLSVH